MKQMITIWILLLFNWSLSAQSEKQNIDSMHDKVIELWLDQPSLALEIGRKALQLATEAQDSMLISKSTRLIGGVYFYKGDYETALEYTNRALALSIAIQDSILIHSCYNNIGLIYVQLSNYQNALEYLFRSLKIKRLLFDNYGEQQTLNNIGLIHEYIEDYEPALSYYEKALEMSRKAKDLNTELYSKNNIISVLIKKKEYALAKEQLDKALKLREKIQNKNRESVTLKLNAQYLITQGKFDEAENYLQESLALKIQIEEKKGISEVYHDLAELAFHKENHTEAIKLLVKSDSIATLIGTIDQVFTNYLLYAKIYARQNKYELSTAYLNNYINQRNERLNQTIKRNLSLVPAKLEDEDTKIKLIESQTALKRKDVMIRLYIMFVVLALPTIILLSMLYRRNRRINLTLEHRNEQVEAQKEEIETQKEYLEQKNKEMLNAKEIINEQKNELEKLNLQLAGQVDKKSQELRKAHEALKSTTLELDNFIYKSSHDLKGPLVRLIGVCDLALIEVKDETAINYINMAKKASVRLNMIVDELKLVSELKEKPIKIEKVNLDKLIDHSFDQVKYIENIDELTLEKNISLTTILADKEIINLIVFNMIQNAAQLLKTFAVVPKLLKIKITEDEVAGIIMQFKLMHVDLFGKDAEDTIHKFTKANSEYNNLSLGLYTVIQCIEKLGGKINLTYEENQSSIFEISIPKNKD